jgi:L-ribulose-5-phosphate 4-epimerase
MIEQEGVIKYQLNHQHGKIVASVDLTALLAYRALLYQLQLIGQDVQRYGGLGYGNISQRCETGSEAFIITGSQTGELAELQPDDFAQVIAANIAQNRIDSQGLRSPSSEALSHAAIYQALPTIQGVVHVHSPALWSCCDVLQLPYTGEHIAYGSIAMAESIQALCRQHADEEAWVFCMRGHQDGIIAAGYSLRTAVSALLHVYAQAIIR